MKKIFAALLALVLAVTAGLTAMADSTPLIYKVTDQEEHSIYMLGTIHVGEESMYPIRGIDQVLDQCDVVAFELGEEDMPVSEDPEEEEDLLGAMS